MKKYCERCQIEIADTDYDNTYRFRRVKYCTECAAIVHREQQNASQRMKRKREKAERKVEREEQLLANARYIQERQKKAKELREERSWIREVPTEEQELRKRLRDTERRLRDSEIRNQQYAVDYINLIRRTESLEEKLNKLETSK